jgi:hypothetical protein
MHVKVRSMITVGTLAGALFFGGAFAAQAGTTTGSCSNTKNGGPTLAQPVTDAGGPNVYGQQTGSTSGIPSAGDAGFDGSGGYLEVGGSPSGGYVSGNNSGAIAIGPASVPASGLNGTVGIDSTPTVCVGSTVAGHGVSAP